jgi:RNA polymerase sigma-70 factor (ECF subfamily)
VPEGNQGETEIGGSARAFRSTQWSLVRRAKDVASPGRKAALEDLIRIYWKPLYFFIRRKGSSVEASKDLIQGFFSDLLSKDYLKYVDCDRGRFRTFLLVALEHYQADGYDRDRSQKRGGGKPVLSLDFQAAESGATLGGVPTHSPDQEFKRDWAIGVMSQALRLVQSDFESTGRGLEFETFREHLAATHPDGASYADMAAVLRTSVEDVRNRVRKCRARYREAILTVIRSYADSEQDVQEEFNDLMSAFS